MAANGFATVHAVSDAEDRLLSADEPLAALQFRCGGELPGTIAVPALLETVRKARRYRLRLGRTINAQDGAHAVTAWVEVEPRRDGEAGCDIVLRNWRNTPLPADDPAEIAALHAAIDREIAELTARLDAGQRLLAVEADAPDLVELCRAMQTGIGRPWTEFVTIEGSSHRQPLHWRLLDGAKIAVAGSARVWQATLLPQEALGNEPEGFELLLTARQPLSRQALAPAAAPADRAPGQFGTIGREIAPVLRQPIARIIANAETIRTRLAGPLTREYADYAADIAAAGQHLLGLVDDLADLEVVEAEDFSTAADRIDLGEVARQAVGILAVRASEKGIAVQLAPQDPHIGAVAEFRRVLQILLNLVSNAIRYSPENSRIVVALDSAAGRARVSVVDEGPGLSADDQQRVFEKFERLGRSGDGGSGLGLYISRRLARTMGGELTVQSVPGEGASFILELPGNPGARDGDLQDRGMSRPALGLPRIPLLRSPGSESAAPGDPDQ